MFTDMYQCMRNEYAKWSLLKLLKLHKAIKILISNAH